MAMGPLCSRPSASIFATASSWLYWTVFVDILSTGNETIAVALYQDAIACQSGGNTKGSTCNLMAPPSCLQDFKDGCCGSCGCRAFNVREGDRHLDAIDGHHAAPFAVQQDLFLVVRRDHDLKLDMPRLA